MILDLSKETWADEGVCKNVKEDIFFPERGASTRGAKALCRTCPVIEDCLDFYVRHEQLFGVWGGVVAPFGRKVLVRQKANRV